MYRFLLSNDEGSILWCDKELNIDWPVIDVILSRKDKGSDSFKDYMIKILK